MTDLQHNEFKKRFSEVLQELQLPFPMTPDHPVWQTPSYEELADMMPFDEANRECWEPKLRQYSEYLVNRATRIDLAQQDPIRYGVDSDVLPHWDKADQMLATQKAVLVLGGWRASKSFYGARTVVKWMRRIKGCRVLCMSESYTASVEVQQRAVHDYLPLEFRDAKKTKALNTAYTEKNGFSDAKFSLPGGRSCLFFNYTDDIRKVQGMKFHIVWCDENVTFNWLETLEGRLIDYGGPLLVTVTPIFGRTPTINWFMQGSTVREWQSARYMEGKPAIPNLGGRSGQMPYVLDCPRKDTSIICFPSEKNPFIPVKELDRMASGVSAGVVMLRLYGWPESEAVAQFPKFDVKVHCIKRDRVPTDVTRYMAFDPHGSRNGFGLWLAIDRYGRKYVYRQWPTPDMGEWAVPGDKPDGKPGPAQYSGAGRGVNDYKRIFLKLEGATWPDGENDAPDTAAAERIFERLGDARAINVNSVRKEGDDEVTFATLMNEELLSGTDETDERKLLLPAMVFHAATGHREGNREIDPDVDVINSWLSYDATKPIEPLVNEPQLFIVGEDCPDLVYSLLTWTGRGGQKGASKDPIDVLRMFTKADVQYIG